MFPRDASPKEVIVSYNVPCALRDGTVLLADVARPAGDGRWPVVLLRTPYGKAIYPINRPLYAQKGFVLVVQDTRQRGVSGGEGDYEPFVNDGSDGAEAVAWAASLPYSNGAVFSIGMSYGGYTQWAAAAEQPPALKGLAPLLSPGSARRTLVYRGGVLELEALVGWFMIVGLETLLRRRWVDGEEFAAAMAGLMQDFDRLFEPGGFDILPLNQFEPLKRNGIGEHFFKLLEEKADGPTVSAAARSQDYSRIEAPALIVGGWYDFFVQAAVDQFEGMRASAATPEAREKTRLIIGRWCHDTGLSNITGESMGKWAAAATALHPEGIDGLAMEFFAGLLTNEAPSTAPVKIWVMGAEQWRDEQEWPIARTQVTPWYLHSGGKANTRYGDGVLSLAEASGPADSYSYDPANPTPTRGGTNLNQNRFAGPSEQRAVEERQDVLVYTSEALLEDLEVTGTAIAEIWAKTDVEDTDFVARLVDVSHDGAAIVVAEGIIRARYRHDPNSFTTAEPLEAGKPYLFRIELTPTSNLFKAGHRVRLQVASSAFPRWARNLNIWDELGGTLEQARVATQVILHDRDHPSRILLPVIPQ